MGPYRFSRNYDRSAGLILPALNISVDYFIRSLSRPTVPPYNVHADTSSNSILESNIKSTEGNIGSMLFTCTPSDTPIHLAPDVSFLSA